MLAIVAIAGIGALTWLARNTRARIEHNERAWFEAQLNALIPPTSHDNDLLEDRLDIDLPNKMGKLGVYRARRAGRPVAAALHTVAPDGYGGPIELLIAVDYAGAVLGVHVLSHHETPGIGNAFEFPGSTWLDKFRGRSLGNTRGWTLRKEGGEFDAFTSATVTPRAIIKAVQRNLEYYQANRERLFDAKPAS
jgi:Na+-translocating ferredoxin:NAD+ oxidoreductase subunit G